MFGLAIQQPGFTKAVQDELDGDGGQDETHDPGQHVDPSFAAASKAPRDGADSERALVTERLFDYS